MAEQVWEASALEWLQLFMAPSSEMGTPAWYSTWLSAPAPQKIEQLFCIRPAIEFYNVTTQTGPHPASCYLMFIGG